MELATDVRVECADGSCGRARYVILDPTRATATHVVVSEPAELGETRLVPLALVAESHPDRIRLSCTREELEKLPLFSEFEYVETDQPYPIDAGSELWMGSLASYGGGPFIDSLAAHEVEHMPPGELSIERGSHIQATDGPVGRVDELVVDQATGHITQLILQRGHLWGRRTIAVPIAAIDHIEGDTVFLKVSRDQVAAMPQVRHQDEKDQGESEPQ